MIIDENFRYIGDAVYVGYDGYALILRTDSHLASDCGNQIILEPNVYCNLIDYFESISKKEVTE